MYYANLYEFVPWRWVDMIIFDCFHPYLIDFWWRTPWVMVELHQGWEGCHWTCSWSCWGWGAGSQGWPGLTARTDQCPASGSADLVSPPGCSSVTPLSSWLSPTNHSSPTCLLSSQTSLSSQELATTRKYLWFDDENEKYFMDLQILQHRNVCVSSLVWSSDLEWRRGYPRYWMNSVDQGSGPWQLSAKYIKV